MDYKSYESFENGVILKDSKNFEPKHIFECGQCFRWNRDSSGTYTGTAFNRVLEVEKREKDILFYNTDIKEFEEIWIPYFDLYRDYDTIKNKLKEDPLLELSMEYGKGIRLLRQEPFEILISFIISSNNRIPMIKRAIENICKKWGNTIEYKGSVYNSFPSPDRLLSARIEDFEACGTGFRAKYIYDTLRRLAELSQNEDYLSFIKALKDDDCHEELMKFTGVGPKVADCIMLFSMAKYSAFPVDVWVKRAMQKLYLAPDVSLKKIRDFGRNKFGELSGFAQQYLFYYARENKIDALRE